MVLDENSLQQFNFSVLLLLLGTHSLFYFGQKSLFFNLDVLFSFFKNWHTLIQIVRNNLDFQSLFVEKRN